MKNPFDNSDEITKPEIANFVFYGRKNKYDKVQYSYKDLLPHLLKYQMDEIIAKSDELRKKTKDFHSLVYILLTTFIPVLDHILPFMDSPLIITDDEFQVFVLKLFKREVSFKEMLRVFKKRGGIICQLLKNHKITKEILKNIPENKTLNDYVNSKELNLYSKKLNQIEIMSFLCNVDFSYITGYKERKFKTPDELFFDDLHSILILESYSFSKLTFLSILPKEMHQRAKEFLRLMYSIISGQTKNLPDFNNFTSQSLEYNQLVPLPENHIQFRKKCILFEDVTFDNNDLIEITSKIMNSNLMIDGFIGFRHCYFDRNLVLDVPYAPKWNLYYDDCIFNKLYQVKDCFSQTLLRFTNCSFFGRVIFGKDAKTKHLPCDIEIRDSVFRPYSTFEISNITEIDGNSFGKVALINTIINGNLKIINLTKKANTLFSIRNIALASPFIIENCYFNSDTVVTGLSFAATPKQAMRDSIKTFTKSLQASGLNNIILENGLSDDDDTNTASVENDDDIKAYKIAYESGFLKPKYAASYLGMSKDNLAKKRMADKQRITRESIPYVGQGKSISYPIDALNAYKLQDWDLLKKLREKYAQKDIETDDSE